MSFIAYVAVGYGLWKNIGLYDLEKSEGNSRTPY